MSSLLTDRPPRRVRAFFDEDLDAFLRTPLSTHRGGIPVTPARPHEKHSKYELRSHNRAHSLHTSVRKCGYQFHCDNEFTCPFCTPKRLRNDSTAIAATLRSAPSAEFATLTLRHDLAVPLGGLWRSLTSAWSIMTSGKGWAVFRSRFAVSGYARAFDCTWSPFTGWHPHWHIAFSFTFSPSGLQLAQFRAELAKRWSDALAHVGASGERYNQHSEPVENSESVAKYLTNGGPLKLSEDGSPSYTYGDLLNAATSGDLAARQLANEYEVASHRMHALVLSGVFKNQPRRPLRREVVFQ